MTSKYDRYWAACMGQIQAALGRAAGGFPAVVATPGLHDLGARQSWYGLAEVCGSVLIRSSMAHATSLGRTVAASEICAPWPQDTFRLTVSTAGDTVTITTADPGQPRREHDPAPAAAPHTCYPCRGTPASTGRPYGPGPGPGHGGPGGT